MKTYLHQKWRQKWVPNLQTEKRWVLMEFLKQKWGTQIQPLRWQHKTQHRVE